MTWDCDGDLKQLTCAWDFRDAAPDAFALTPVKLDSWGGFVFVNFDPEAGPLQDYLEGLPEHFAQATVPKFRPGGILLVHAGGGAGLFSAIIAGWANGATGSQPTTWEIRS